MFAFALFLALHFTQATTTHHYPRPITHPIIVTGRY